VIVGWIFLFDCGRVGAFLHSNSIRKYSPVQSLSIPIPIRYKNRNQTRKQHVNPQRKFPIFVQKCSSFIKLVLKEIYYYNMVKIFKEHQTGKSHSENACDWGAVYLISMHGIFLRLQKIPGFY
jgi:hypothetical protein